MPSVGQSTSTVTGEAGVSLDAEKDLALHTVLDLTTAHHELQHLVDGMLRVFLGEKQERFSEAHHMKKQELNNKGKQGRIVSSPTAGSSLWCRVQSLK